MSLAVMLSTDESLFICDMAETYHILDYKALPVNLLAVLASGLRENSRIKMKIAGITYIPPEVVLPQVADYLMLIAKSLGGSKKKLTFMTDIMYSKEDKKQKPARGFNSGADFDAAWKRLTGDNNG